MGALRCLHLVKPGVVIPLMGTNLESGARVPSVPDRFWRHVAGQMRLTARQHADVVAMRLVWEGMHARWAGRVGAGRAGSRRRGSFC
jgi:hypothetical protein